MDFAEFAKLLFPYYGANRTQADFVVMLIEAVVDEADCREISILNQKRNYLGRIFSGSKPLPQKSAREVNGRLNKAKFEEFLSDFDLTNDAIDELGDDLTARGFNTENRYEIPGLCANIFVDIIKGVAAVPKVENTTILGVRRNYNINDQAFVLLAETGSKCLKCGRILALKKNGMNTNYMEVLKLSDEEKGVFCVSCARQMVDASDEEKLVLVSEKRELERLAAPRETLSRYQLEREVEELLEEVDLLDVSEETRLKMIPYKVENKISEKRLKERILQDVRELYGGVNDVLDRMAGENKLNVEQFARNVRRMYEDASDGDISQSDIYYMLVESLYDKTRRKHRTACEVIISYFVQRCEVFDEIAK